MYVPRVKLLCINILDKNEKVFSRVYWNFALVFCGTGAIIINQETNDEVSHAGIAMTFGLIVMAMIYALGNISGGTH